MKNSDFSFLILLKAVKSFYVLYSPRLIWLSGANYGGIDELKWRD
jgi:hypothetical protein